MNKQDLTYKTIELSNGNRFYVRGVATSYAIQWLKFSKKNGWALRSASSAGSLGSISVDEMLANLTNGHFKIVED